jgi:myxalamid-type nonribosomal peptide synthetase MxaA
MLDQDQLNNQTDTPQISETEHIVGGIWAEVLQQAKINPEDNFFELGGDSLMTMMVMFRVNNELHVDMPPYAISQSPTLREFCQIIDNQMYTSGSGILLEEEFDAPEVETGVI